MSFLFFKKYSKNYIFGAVVLLVLALALGYAQYQFSREKADIVSFAKGQEALYLAIPESNNVVLTLSSSRIPGSGVSDTFLYSIEPDTHDTPTAFVLADDAKHIIDAGEVNGAQAVIMPFYTDFGGSGTFLYVGLFSRIKEPRIPNETLKHESSLFIGDRVLLTGISKNSDGVFAISYLTRKDDEPMAANPTVPAIKYITVIPTASLVEVADDYSSQDKNRQIDEIDEIAHWKTFVPDAAIENFSMIFKYPENMPTDYVHFQKWPPRVWATDADLVCQEQGLGVIGGPDMITKKIINGRIYCIESASEGSVGTIYTNYTYSTKANDLRKGEGERVTAINFIFAYPQCANYDEAQRTDCENERQNFDLDALIDKIVQTGSVFQ